jgi:glucokinase
MEIIAGDIGGTKSWLARVAESEGLDRPPRFERVYASADFADAASLLRQFLRDAGLAVPPRTMVLGLPGAITGRKARLTNLDWLLDADALEAEFGIAEVRFINDFQAAAEGVATLAAADCVALNARPPEPGGVRAITGAGTGLGLAWMMVDATGQYRAWPTEGGHVDFAPANSAQARLLEFVRAELDGCGRAAHVSWERLISGLGLASLYRFCCREAGVAASATAALDGAAVSALAAAGDAAADAALDLFVDLYGAWAGNVALLYKPSGGLYLAGGVSIHLRQRLQAPRFMAACADKGRMRGVVEATPIYLINNKRLGVQGAIRTALRTATN